MDKFTGDMACKLLRMGLLLPVMDGDRYSDVRLRDIALRQHELYKECQKLELAAKNIASEEFWSVRTFRN